MKQSVEHIVCSIVGSLSLPAMLVVALLSGCGSGDATSMLPTVRINTPRSVPITSRDVWTRDCRLRIVGADGIVLFRTVYADVRGRGHSTFEKPKMPLAVRLDDKEPLLDMAPGRRWALLANFMDHSLLRNMLALGVARRTSLAWTPDCRPVNLVLNGEPQGCYLLCEQVRVASDRVEIDEKEGFLFELDAHDDGDARFLTTHRRLPVNIKSPSEPTYQQQAEARRLFDEIEEKLYSPRPDMRELYARYIDAQSFADWWLVHELTQNAEPNGPRSCYMQRDCNGKLVAGPVWDFDLAFIDVDVDSGGDLRPARLNRPDVRRLNVNTIYNRNSLWYDKLLSDPTFVSIVEQRWSALKPKMPDLIDEFDRWRQLIAPSAEADQRMWAHQDPARFDTLTTFNESADNLRATFLRRVGVMDSLIATLRQP